mgnify:CR=1 FL=1
MSDEESGVVFKGFAAISLILTSILVTIFWLGLVKVSQSEPFVVAPEQSSTQALTPEDLGQLRRQVATAEDQAKADDRIAEARRDFVQYVQAHQRELEMQHQKEHIDLLLAVRNAELEVVKQEVLRADAERQGEKQEAILTALSQLASQRQAQGSSPSGAQRTSASF